MEFTADFVQIQGILLSLEAGGSLKGIRYRGGNEDRILNTLKELRTLFCAKKYIENDVVNDRYGQELRQILYFLVLNTDLSVSLPAGDNAHLMNIAPQLSPCLLANVVSGLDLCKHFCGVMETLPLEAVAELMAEMNVCLKKANLNVHLKNADLLLHLTISKLAREEDSKKRDDCFEKLSEVACEMLLNLTGMHATDVTSINQETLYTYMGYTILSLLGLLLQIEPHKFVLMRLVEKIVQACCTVLMAVTIDVFCSWAEVDEDCQNLQAVISGQAYQVVERYNKFKPAKELITMLGTVAKKPKTLTELIHQSDVSKMIEMIDAGDRNQKQWFTALLNTQALQDKETVACINRWAHLCTKEDVCRLLNLSVSCNTRDGKNVVIKCASTLSLENIQIITARHFHKNGVSHNLNEDIQQQLVHLFNSIQAQEDKRGEFSRDFYLLFLQNPEAVLTHTLLECLKNSFYTRALDHTLSSLRCVASILQSSALNVLNKAILSASCDDINCNNYTELLSGLVRNEFFSVDVVVAEVILPTIQISLDEKKYEKLQKELEILNGIEGHVALKQDTETLFVTLFDIMRTCRCKFFQFNRAKQEIVKEVVTFLSSHTYTNYYFACEIPEPEEEDILDSYYLKRIFQRNSSDLLESVLPEGHLENHVKTITYLVKVLPSCVAQEWSMICSELCDIYGVQKPAEFFVDCMILLCQLIISQKSDSTELESMLNSLKYCLQNFGIVIKEGIQSRQLRLEDDVSLTKDVCRLLKHLPKPLKSEDGLSLANLLSEPSLKSLRTDKRFACLLVSINEPYICHMLAQKVLN